MRSNMVFIGFAPNLTPKDVRTALSYIFLPWKWCSLKSGKYIAQVEHSIGEYFGKDYRALCFDSGRSALYASLMALGVGKGDEVLVQAFTCVVVINAIKLTGAKPIYLDINDTYNIDTDSIADTINACTKAIIIQHTFGIPADIEKISFIAKKHGLALIEDCAHSLGTVSDTMRLGTYGDIAILSFGPDKVISCVRGGAIVTRNLLLYEKCLLLKKGFPRLSYRQIFKSLFYAPLFFIGKLTYGIFIGKFLLYAAKKLKLIPRIIDECEKEGIWPSMYPAQLPNALAQILTHQLNDLDRINNHRKKIARAYDTHITNPKIKKSLLSEDAMYLRYPIQVDDPKEFMRQAKQCGMILGDWYRTIVAPNDVNQDATGYIQGSCPRAEYAVNRVINLPTDRNITTADTIRIIKFCNEYYARSKDS